MYFDSKLVMTDTQDFKYNLCRNGYALVNGLWKPPNGEYIY